MASGKPAVAVVGAGNWARHASIPAWQRDPRTQVDSAGYAGLTGSMPGLK